MIRREMRDICKKNHNCFTCPVHFRDAVCLYQRDGKWYVPADYPEDILDEEALTHAEFRQRRIDA